MAGPRPYAIWDETKRAVVPRRRFVYARRAHNFAILECWWSAAGRSFTVVNVTRGWRVLQGYTRGLHGVHKMFEKEKE